MSTLDFIELAADQEADLKVDLGRWLGRHEALDLVSRCCSAADVRCFQEIRDKKLYLATARNWDEFCRTDLQSSRKKIDGLIQRLEELGPGFFALSEMTRVNPEEFRLLGPTPDGKVTVDGKPVEITEKNREKLQAAVSAARSQRRAMAAARKSFRDVLALCDSLVEKLEKPPSLPDTGEKLDLAAALNRMYIAAAGLGVIRVDVRH